MKKVSKKVVAVVVTYNRKELLKECIDALLSGNYEDLEILVVDNASTDGTEQSISKYIKNKKIIYKNTGENLGGAGGFNFGMKEAYNLGADYVWLMDDDCIVKSDSLKKLLQASENLNDDFGFLSSKVIWTDGTLALMNKPKTNLKNPIGERNNENTQIIMGTFVSMLIRREMIEEFGFPITDFFIWTDDLEYSRRISKKYPCYYIPSSVVVHKSKDNKGSDISKSDEDRLDRFYYAYRNESFLYRREGVTGRLYFTLRIFKHLAKVVIHGGKTRKKRLLIMSKGLRDGRKFYPVIEKLDVTALKKVKNEK